MIRNWEGILPALWTPTDAEGNLLEAGLRANLKFMVERGIHGILALGSTGEFLHLDQSLKQRVLEITVELAGSIPVIANISDIRPKIVRQQAELARNVGAAAVSVLPPYFFPVNQSDLIEFFVRAGDSARLPLFLYNFPERTGNRIDLETVSAVADRIPLAGIKQSGAEFEYHKDLVALGRKKNFAVVTGSDTRLAEAMGLGVIGCVSGLSNAVPELTVAIYNAVKNGDSALAVEATARMRIVGQLVDKIEFPFNIAAIIEGRRLDAGCPKSIVSEKTRKLHHSLVREFESLFKDWNLI
ncbi:MAG: dihydrodipicolinate synthase family protein [Verrucomicrobia bacterium]|nr:dihydrodipicolinate synthase family protein [Verrucomicrobiota bacterium]